MVLEQGGHSHEDHCTLVLAYAGCIVAAIEETDSKVPSPFQVWTSAARSASSGRRNLLRDANRLSMEGCSTTVRFGKQSSSVFPRLVPARRISQALEAGSRRIRQASRNCLALADAGRSHDQGASWRGKKQGPTPPTEENSARNGQSSATPGASSWVSPSVQRTSMTSSWPFRRWKAYPFTAHNRARTISNTFVPTRPTNHANSVACSFAAITCRTSSHEAKRHHNFGNIRTPKPDVGSTNEPNPGSTDFAES